MSDEKRKPRKPPLFDIAVERQCSRWLTDHSCGKEPVVHVVWSWDEDGGASGFVCVDHARELGSVWTYAARHPVGADCGMPGSMWHPDTCRCDDTLEVGDESALVLVGAVGTREHTR